MAGIELGIPYTLNSPGGVAAAVLNSPNDGNFVGYVTDITGLDSPGVRENAQVITSGDGGHHGRFWKDRRPWTISGIIQPSFPLLARDVAQEKLEGVVMACTQQDGQLLWTPADGISRYINFRAQQPVRITTGQSNVVKNFQVAGVTEDWRVTAQNASNISASGPVTVSGVQYITTTSAQNLGNADAAPKFTIVGPFSYIGGIEIFNLTTGKWITLGTTIAAGVTMTIDLTGRYPVAYDSNGVDWYGLFATGSDFSIAVAGTATVTNGLNTFQLKGLGMTGATQFNVSWNHSWV